MDDLLPLVIFDDGAPVSEHVSSDCQLEDSLLGQTQGMRDEQGVAVELNTLWEVSCSGLVLSTVSNFRTSQSTGILCRYTAIQDVLNENQPCWNPNPCQRLLLCHP